MSALQINWPTDIDQNVFLQQYWQQKPLLIPQAFAAFDNPLEADELAGLACDEDANSRFMQRVDGNEWRMCSGPLSAEFFDEITGHEWSLLVSDVEKLLPDFRQYLQPFRFLPDWRIDDLMISYAPVGGSVGAHVDQYDVFLLQADGEREWQIETSPRVGHQPSVSSSISLLGDFSADRTMQLSAGDMLYLPPGFAHHGIATVDPCMTWSIGFRAPTAEEMLPSILRLLCDGAEDNTALTERFTDNNRAAALNPGHIDASDLGKLREQVRAALTIDDALLDLLIGRFLTESGNEAFDAPGTLEWPAVKAQLDSGKTLVCNSQIKLATMQNGGALMLLADGDAYACSSELSTCLCQQRCCTASDIQTAQDQQTVTDLLNRQRLLFDDDLLDDDLLDDDLAEPVAD